MEVIETGFLASVVIYHNSVTLDGSNEYFMVSPLMMVSKLWQMQYTVCKWQCSSGISESMP